jgi:hypothetical protein
VQIQCSKTPSFNPDTSVESQLNNNGTALGPLPEVKLGGNIDCLLKISTTSEGCNEKRTKTPTTFLKRRSSNPV